jgi:hypothetical protein
MSISTKAPTGGRRLTVVEHDSEIVERIYSAAARLGPLLALCGLMGGAGTTTLAYLVALAAAREGAGPVLVADTGGRSGGLAARAGVETPHSLPELASDLADGLPLRGGLYATGPAGLRVLATGPACTSTHAYEELTSLLIDAREAHCLTVVDCGTLSRDVDQVAAAVSTHAAWVMPATTYGVTRGRAVLEASPHVAGNELVVARRDIRQSKAPLRELRRIAYERQAPLVLVPHLPGLDTGRLEGAMEAAQVPVQAILGALRR